MTGWDVIQLGKIIKETLTGTHGKAERQNTQSIAQFISYTVASYLAQGLCEIYETKCSINS